MENKKKLPLRLLICALVLVLCGSLLANLFNTGLWTVKVSRVCFETERGTLSGLLYMPKGVDANNPRPAISVTHGYLNSAEMQDANAIELSRRGFVVLALDMYDHGHSAGNAENTGAFFSFWPRAQYDAVQYLYEQPYVLKDENGNGIIGVTGHSMGGFSSAMAMWYDEQDFAEAGIRKIYCGLTEGADYQWASYLGLTPEVAAQQGGGRIQGKVAAQYDEFFFNADDAPAGTVRKKDFVSTTAGKTFLEQEAPQAGVWYDTADGGRRIVYQPAETHPWNHFSKTSTANAVEFYTTAFAAYSTGIKDIAPTSQVWFLKELSECVALVGFVLFVLALALTIIELPFFNKAKTGALQPLPSVQGGALKAVTAVILAVAILVPGLFFIGMYDGNAANKNILFWCELAVTVCAAALAFLGFKKEQKKGYLVGGALAVISGAALAVVLKSSLYSGNFWVAPVVNSVSYWTLCCALISLLVMSAVYVALKARNGVKLANYGVVFNPMAIVASCLGAIVVVAVSYALLFLVDAVFKTDFRIWTFAFKTFDCNILPAILKYLPTFLFYYLISTAAITINTNTQKLQGVKGYLLAMCLNAGGITLWLIRQYVTLFATGVGAHPTAALSGIVLVAMVPTLAIAACISRALYKRTGNIWLPAFINGLLITIMTVANTTVYFK